MVKIIKDNFVFRSVTKDDYDIINKLCDMRFGDGYLSRKKFESWFADPDLFLCVEYDGIFVGYVSFLPESPEKIAQCMKLDVDDVRKSAQGMDAIHCNSTALFPEFEHSGYMKQLWAIILDIVEKKGYKAAYGPAWKYHGFVPMDKLLTRFGFTPIAEKQMLWYDDLDYNCIICKGRCKCSGVIYKKVF